MEKRGGCLLSAERSPLRPIESQAGGFLHQALGAIALLGGEIGVIALVPDDNAIEIGIQVFIDRTMFCFPDFSSPDSGRSSVFHRICR